MKSGFSWWTLCSTWLRHSSLPPLWISMISRYSLLWLRFDLVSTKHLSSSLIWKAGFARTRSGWVECSSGTEITFAGLFQDLRAAIDDIHLTSLKLKKAVVANPKRCKEFENLTWQWFSGTSDGIIDFRRPLQGFDEAEEKPFSWQTPIGGAYKPAKHQIWLFSTSASKY